MFDPNFSNQMAMTKLWPIHITLMLVGCLTKTCMFTHNFMLNDVASGSDMTLCNKIDKPLVVNLFINIT